MRARPIALLVVAFLTAGCGSSTGSVDSDGGSSGGSEASGDVVLATTTSTQDTGLLDELIPLFESGSDCVVKTVAVGSGEAMTMGERGDADVLLVHSPDAEAEFMEAGDGSSRLAVMHNDFVVVGPAEDPADVADASDAADALARIAEDEQPFASRADDSGTHAKELSLWQEAGLEPGGSWYVETGQGMGQTLTIADQKAAYTLSDRGTFLATTGLDSEIAFEGSEDLLNPYHVIVVDHTGTNRACAEEFSAWIVSKPAQARIREFGVEEYGEPLFVPDA
jgi:tungstate transport system substrate-binding protein